MCRGRARQQKRDEERSGLCGWAGSDEDRHGGPIVVGKDLDTELNKLAWKDTLNVPMKTTLRVLIDFDERPGEWMFHCHILDHAEGGLMGTVMLGPGEPTGHQHTKKP